MSQLTIIIGPIADEATPQPTVWDLRERYRIALEQHKAIYGQARAAGWRDPQTGYWLDTIALAEKTIDGTFAELLTAIRSASSLWNS